MDLSKREKNLAILLATSLIGVLIYVFVISPLLDSSENEESSAVDIHTKAKLLNKTYQEYKEIKEKRTRIASLLNSNNENIATFIKQLATSNNLANISTNSSTTIIQNKYSKITTVIRINGVATQQLMNFLFAIENSNKLLTISYLKITPGLRDTKTVDANINIESYTKK